MDGSNIFVANKGHGLCTEILQRFRIKTLCAEHQNHRLDQLAGLKQLCDGLNREAGYINPLLGNRDQQLFVYQPVQSFPDGCTADTQKLTDIFFLQMKTGSKFIVEYHILQLVIRIGAQRL